MRGESVALAYSEGLADDAAGVPNTATTRFQIASVSKQFTAAAALLLVQRGVLGLDDPMSRWIGRCPESWSGITLRHLLTHTSGLPHWHAYHEQLTGVDYVPADELVALFQTKEPITPPGQAWSYSSPAYAMLGLIVQRAADQTYGDFLRDGIFAPLGLERTFVGMPHGRPDCARGYTDGAAEVSLELDSVNLGAGDAWSTPADLIAWTDQLRAGRLLKQQSLDFMFTPVWPTAAQPGAATYGCGWYCEPVGGEPMYYHSGDNAGFQAFNAVLPVSGRRFAIVTNEYATDLAAAIQAVLAV
jgi:CubicO group peptidase (beta-lactamase class C family)